MLYYSQISFGRSVFDWLKGHLLPCPFKYLTGIDCPGCGFQRSVLALLQGNLHDSLALYPPAIPLLIAFAYVFADKQWNLDTPTHFIKKTVYMVTASIILVSYGLKMWHLYGHYIASV
ncbi:DUF2752 domain-containing protein [Mucilaginibacter gynuensis]|uniref:DUF2752 domain-containing protein n=1 Tax=Mucilaginibacter gynuensis TaxID=1302236 RepID=UPI0031E92B37